MRKACFNMVNVFDLSMFGLLFRFKGLNNKSTITRYYREDQAGPLESLFNNLPDPLKKRV